MLQFSEEHEMIRKLIRRWTTSKLEPKVDALEAGEPPYELMRDFANTFGIPDMVRGMFAKLEQRAAKGADGDDPPPRAKGALAASDPALSAIVSIELSRVCPGFALAFGATGGLAGGAIMGKGTLEQKKRWALPIMTLEKIGALMGVTRERIRQIRERAFEKLRESPDGTALSGFWKTAD